MVKATADGYTLGLLNQPRIVISPDLQRLPFDPIRDMAPVSQVAASLYVLIVHHAVPAKNVQEIGGRVTMTFGPVASFLPLAREGKLRALAVTSPKRSAQAPELPTVAESGYPGFEVTNWYGLLGPARTPPAIIGKLHRETVRALALPDLHARLGALGLEAIGSSPAEFAAVINSEIPRWAKLIREAGIKPDR